VECGYVRHLLICRGSGQGGRGGIVMGVGRDMILAIVSWRDIPWT
jgi:hypothetical protein